MNLLQQFPDVSMQRRFLNQKRTQKEMGSTEEHNDNDKELDLYYDAEFRKWHAKVALIIVLIITCFSATVIGVSKLF